MTIDSKKIKEYETWAKNDAKYFIIQNRNDETVDEYFKRCIKIYQPERLVKQFKYTLEQVDQVLGIYNEAFWKSFRFWQDKKMKIDATIKEYEPIFKEAEEIAKKVDVSDISDGFPCGWVHLYLLPEAQKTELGKALKTLSDAETPIYQYKLPVKTPSYGQCIAFDERICKVVADFLNSKGIPTGTYQVID